MARLDSGKTNFINDLRNFLDGKSDFDVLQTRDGRTVNIEKIDRQGTYPIQGVIKNTVGNGWTPSTWRHTGDYSHINTIHDGNLVLLTNDELQPKVTAQLVSAPLFTSLAPAPVVEEPQLVEEPQPAEDPATLVEPARPFIVRLMEAMALQDFGGMMVQTIDGQPVEIITANGRGEECILGYIGERLDPDSWSTEGKYDVRGSHELDLELVPKPPKSLGWFYMCRTNLKQPNLPVLYQSNGPFESQYWAQVNAKRQSEQVVAVYELFEKQGLE